ncbi:MAG TPA: aldo/keto reductase [Streptosporangiaceae bacterium]|nr:aldo/keto reductase [Streptosporangiaceae bacterium]
MTGPEQPGPDLQRHVSSFRSPDTHRTRSRQSLAAPDAGIRRGCLTVGAALPGALIVVWAQLAIAFVLRHPAVTCAIIGPRTMEHLQSQLPAAEVTLTDDVLGRMDEIVAPGVTINPADGGWVSPALKPTARRRQDAGSRSSPGRRACLRQ